MRAKRAAKCAMTVNYDKSEVKKRRSITIKPSITENNLVNARKKLSF